MLKKTKLAGSTALNPLILSAFLSTFAQTIPVKAQEVDLSQAAVFFREADKIVTKAAMVLIEEVEKRSGISPARLNRWSGMDERPLIAIGTESAMEPFYRPYREQLAALEPPGPEGYRILLVREPRPRLYIIGSDPRGVFYGTGQLLRKAALAAGKFSIDADISRSSTPRFEIRGHQLGYRAKTNAYDAWSVEQFDQYIRELGIFGANSIEIIPPRTDDDLTSPHMKRSPLEMTAEQSRIIDSYGMDVWVWYPNMGEDYADPDSIRFELNLREEIFVKCPRIDVVFVPGGDPGDLHPDTLFSWLSRVARLLNKYHPDAELWVSPQAFRPTKEWLDAFYRNVNENPDWFGGVVFGPWVKTPLPEIRRLISPNIPVRRYPDITHSISCQYPVREWDLAYAVTLGRECINPRPLDHKHIHNALARYAEGSIGYSEGINDDVNKFIWLDQDWNPSTPVLETLRDYGRLFINAGHAESVAQGLLALERNWRGPLLSNDQVEITLQQWREMESSADAMYADPIFSGSNGKDALQSKSPGNYRFQLGLLRAYYDAYQKRRLIYETELEQRALDALRTATPSRCLSAVDSAERILLSAQSHRVAQDYWRRCQELADALFRSVGAQLTVSRHGAISLGRGAFIDAIDEPLNDVRWLLYRFEKLRGLADEDERMAAIEQILNRTNPGPGGCYDNFGSPGSLERVRAGAGWDTDPGGLLSPRISFGVGARGQEWVHEVRARGFEGIATPRAWMNQVTALYDTPLSLRYSGLDPQGSYTLRVAYTGRFRSSMRLVVDGKFELHDYMRTGISPIYEFKIPADALEDGKIELTWTCPEGARGAQVAEAWLIKERDRIK